MKKTKTATITFHASHNYGSNLQAYALQYVIQSMGYENEILNFRTPIQKDLYRVIRHNLTFRSAIKNLLHLLYYKSLKNAEEKYESFIHNNLNITNEYTSEDDLKAAKLEYDVYIAGSDQIWNPIPRDFDWAYFLSFVHKGKKMSYAPSFGQLSSLGNSDIQNRIANLLRQFDFISVRDKGTADNVKKLIGIAPPIVLDPTLLLDKNQWISLIANKKKLIEGNYIYFYSLVATPERMNIIKRVAKTTGLPVVVSYFSNQYDVFNPFIKCYDAGPLDFLTLIRDAKLVVSSSFHCTVFSILLNVPFFAIDGMTDARIRTLLTTTGLENREITLANVEKKSMETFDIDFDRVNQCIEKARKPSFEFLKKSLEA